MLYTTRNSEALRKTVTGLPILMLLTGIAGGSQALAQTAPNPLQIVGAGIDGQTGAIFAAHITNIAVNDSTDEWSGGTMTLEGGQNIIIPANMVMDLPANRLTLRNFCFGDQVPANELSPLIVGDSSLCGVGHLASILANRQADGTVIAGDVFISKDDVAIQGIVTAINTDASFVVNGTHRVRLNDPDAVHSNQPGPNNGSPDVRYTNDPSNYTFIATTGYPICVNGPNCSANSGRLPGGSGPAVDATRFEPLMVGDHVTTEGGIECDALGANCYQSAHTMMVNTEISTIGPIDQVLVEEAEWDINNFANQRMRGLNIGVVSDASSSVSMYRVVLNGASDALGATGCVADQMFADTAACDAVGGVGSCGGQGIAGNGGQVVKQNYDWDFIIGESSPERNPARVLGQAGDPAGLMDPLLSDADNSFRIMAPIGRDIVYKSSKWEAAVTAFEASTGPDPSNMVFDASGNPAQWGQYLSPNGVGHPEWNEIDLTGFNTPFIFEGINWNMDRRLGPEGGADSLASAPLYTLGLSPFPSSGLSGFAVIESLIATAGGRGSPSAPVGVPQNFAPDILDRDACSGSIAARPLVIDTTVIAAAPPVIESAGATPVACTDPIQVCSHALVTADGTPVGIFNNGDTLNIAGQSVSIEAVATGLTTRVNMEVPEDLGITPRGGVVDSQAPFMLLPDGRDGIVPVTFAAGTYSLTSQPLGARGGFVGTPLTTVFTVQ